MDHDFCNAVINLVANRALSTLFRPLPCIYIIVDTVLISTTPASGSFSTTSGSFSAATLPFEPGVKWLPGWMDYSSSLLIRYNKKALLFFFGKISKVRFIFDPLKIQKKSIFPKPLFLSFLAKSFFWKKKFKKIYFIKIFFGKYIS